MAQREPDTPEEILRKFSDAISGMDTSELKQLAAGLLTPGRGSVASPPRHGRRTSRRTHAAVYRVRVDLEHSRPPIWRLIDVRSDVTLDALHQILQAAFDWTDSHLHRFALGDSVFDQDAELFLCPYDVDEGEDDGVPASEVHLDETLSTPGDVLRYCYDYGDSWDLIITLTSVRDLEDQSAPPAVCVDGRRAAPPEDCGGLRDATDLAEVLDDPGRFDLAEVNEALTNPFVLLRDSGLDHRLHDLILRLRGTPVGDDLVARLMGLTQRRDEHSPEQRATALHPLLWFLDHVGVRGLDLTSAGYLKPADVTAAAAVLPDAANWIGTRNREIHTYPVLAFRESLQRLGLLRKNRGRLLLTKAGAAVRGNPELLWHHLARRLPLGKDQDMEVPAGLLALVYAASSPAGHVPTSTIADTLTYLGWREGGRSPISLHAAGSASGRTLAVLQNITTGPRARRPSDELSDVAVELARDALFKSHGS